MSRTYPNRPPSWNSRMRRGHKKDLSEAQNHKCCHCGSEMDPTVQIEFSLDENKEKYPTDYPSFEHACPIAWGGDNKIENIAIACMRCNQLGSKLIPMFSKFIKKIEMSKEDMVYLYAQAVNNALKEIHVSL